MNKMDLIYKILAWLDHQPVTEESQAIYEDLCSELPSENIYDVVGREMALTEEQV